MVSDDEVSTDGSMVSLVGQWRYWIDDGCGRLHGRQVCRMGIESELSSVEKEMKWENAVPCFEGGRG